MTEDLHEHEIDGLFRSGLEGAEDSPSPGLWSAIEKGLEAAPPPPAPPPAPPAGGQWMHPLLLKGMAGIAVLATVGTISYYLGRNSQRREERKANQTETASLKEQSSNPATTKDSKSNHSLKTVEQPQTVDPRENASPTKPNDMSSRMKTDPAVKSEAAEKTWQTEHSGVTEAASSRSSAPPQRTPSSDLSSNTPPGNQKTVSGKALPSQAMKAADPAGGLPGVKAFAKADAPRTSEDRGVSIANAKSSALTEMERKGYQPQVSHAASPSGRLWNLVAPDPTSLRISNPVATMKETSQKTGNARPVIRRETASLFSILPVVSLNTTQKKIEEDENFGPRNGREHREMAETESYGSTVSPGLYAAIDISPKLSIQSGFSELRNEISISPKEIRAVKDRDDKVRYRLDCSAGSFFIDPKTGTTPGIGDSIRLNGSDVRTRYASIPVHLLYRVGSGRVRGFAMAGAEVNILVNRNATTTFQNAAGLSFGTVRAEGLKNATVNAVVGAGLELGMGRRMAFTLMPQYRVALKSPNVNAPVKTYPKTFSVSAGLRLRF